MAPAKINLTLEVLSRREDGYHALRSVMVPLALHDELLVEPSAQFAFTCDVSGLSGEDNLVVRAVRALGPPPPVSIALRKSIPSQAGLGGGSSDAATALLAAMDGAFGAPPAVDWMALARSLGSDVPFFLARSGALVEGTGERVTPLGALPAWHALVLKPPAAVSTAAAYAALDRIERPSRPRNASASLALLTALQRADFDATVRHLHNDFEAVVAAAEPSVAQALAALRRAGAGHALLAGSGSCVFALARTSAEIARIEARLDLPASFQRFAAPFAATPAWRGTP